MKLPKPTTPYLEPSPGIALLPVERHSVSFASLVRQAMVEYQPECVALEMPRPLKGHFLDAIDRLPSIHLLAFMGLGDGEAAVLPVDPCDGLVEAIRLARDNGIPVEFVDTIAAGRNQAYRPPPDPLAIDEIGGGAWIRCCLALDDSREAAAKEQVMAGRLARLRSRGRVLFIGSVGHFPPLARLLEKPDQLADVPEAEDEQVLIRVLPAQKRHLPHLLGEMPYLTYLYEVFRSQASEEESFPVLDGLERILRLAEERYGSEFDEAINLTEWRALFQFGRNLSLVRGGLRPGMYELVTSAQACVDGDFGAIVLDIASSYPPAVVERSDGREDDDHRRRSLDLYVDMGDGLRKALPAYPRPDLQSVEFRFLRRRPTREQRDEWRQDFLETFGMSICSWPPEDERIEKFFDFLRKRALASISEEHTLVEEFTSSMQDGLDFRETMRNWHTGKLYVRRERIPPGKVGPVVLVWRDLPAQTEGLWRSTLYAENQNESDISVYCAPLADEMVGPMISRTEYHGILSVFPARGIPDVWQIPPLYGWGTCGRMLLAAAIYLSTERYVAWVADRPPDADLEELARTHRVGLIHLPLASFSRSTLKKLRKVHILGSRQARGWAGDYIED